ncbi:MAG: polyprenol monophosphomannose synthase, partial [Nanoarchaeota archaeon]
EYDVVIASKYAKGGKDSRGFARVVTSRALNLFGSIVLGISIKDLTSGFYLVKKEVFKKVRLKDHGYAEYCIKFAWDIKKKGYRVKEVPYTVIDREKGHSKSYKNILNFLKNGYLCVREIMKLRFS